MKKKGNKMQEEWKTETTTWKAKMKAPDDKLQELETELLYIKDLPTSEEGSKALITLKDENAALKAQIAAIQVAIDGKYVKFPQQISKGEQEMLKWTDVVKKGVTPPKKEVIFETVEEERRRSHKSLTVWNCNGTLRSDPGGFHETYADRGIIFYTETHRDLKEGA